MYILDLFGIDFMIVYYDILIGYESESELDQTLTRNDNCYE